MSNIINGTDGNDKIFGSADGDEIYAGAGADQIYAEGGDDYVDGGEGNDYIVGGEGNDTMYGGDGNDEFVVYGSVNGAAPTTGFDEIDGGAGIDTIRVMHSGASYEVNSFTLTNQMRVERLIGSYYTDLLDASGVMNSVTVNGDSGNDTVLGGGGNDTLYGGEGADQIIDDIGDDTLYVDADDTLINAGSGRDTLIVASRETRGVTVDLKKSGIEIAIGGAGNDRFSGGGDIQVELNLDGRNGNDQLYGGALNDVLIGGAGDDYIVGYAGNDTMYGGDGNDEFVVYGSVNGAAPTTGFDEIDGGAGTDTILVMHSGPTYEVNSFTLTQRMNVERVIGSYYTDRLDASSLTASVLIDASFGNDTVLGGSGNDTLAGGKGADQLTGGAGDDTLHVDADDTVVNGGSGYDTVVAAWNETRGLRVNLETSSIEAAVGGAGNDSFYGNDGMWVALSLDGKDGDDYLTGGRLNDVIKGGNGSDYIWGGSGDDLLTGGDGDDMIVGHAGVDTIDGGAGNDRIHFEGFDKIDGGAGYDTAVVNHFTDTFLNLAASRIEHVIGNDGNDTFVAGDGAWEGVTMEGQNGNDILVGGTWNDILDGGDGNDELTAGWGNDRLTGGAGTDTFVWDASLYQGTDTVLDFEGAGVDGGDVIRLVNFTRFEDLAGRITQNGSDTFIDVNDGLRIVLVGINAASLTAEDFAFA